MKDYTESNRNTESNFSARLKLRNNRILDGYPKAFPDEFYELYEGAIASEENILTELSAVDQLHGAEFTEDIIDCLSCFPHEERVKTITNLFSDKLGGRKIIADISQPYLSGVMSGFLLGWTDWVERKPENETNNTISSESSD